MQPSIGKRYLGKIIINEKSFKAHGTFASLYAAQAWLSENGYTYGSMCAPQQNIAIVKGDYDLPQKWRNLNRYEKKMIHGVIESSDFREGEVKVYLFK